MSAAPLPTDARWVPAAQLADFGARPVIGVTCAGRRLALYALDDGVYASDEACPHVGAALSRGAVVDGYIECPQHYALFDIRTGASDGAVTAKAVRTYPVKVEGGQVFVALPGSEETRS